MLKHGLFLVSFLYFISLSGQEINVPFIKDTSFLYKGQSKTALFFGTDIGQNAFLKQFKLFLKEKFNTSLKVDFKRKTEVFYLTRAFVAPSYFDAAPTILHVAFIKIKKDSMVWILFPDKEIFIEKWENMGNVFLVDKLPILYNMEFDVLKKDVHFLEKELDSYRNKLISNRKLIMKLEKENFSLEGLIREEEDSLREMIKKLSDKIKKWEKLKAVP
jgi:hypothetical protein